MALSVYITTLNQRHQLGNATEHSFRGDLQTLLEQSCSQRIMQEIDTVGGI